MRRARPQFQMTDGFADIHPDVVAGVAAVAGAWVGAWLARGVRPRTGETIAFAGALLTLLAVLNGPLHALSDRYLFSAHMVQHLALTLAVPPLLLIGIPGWMVDGLLQRRTAARLARVLTRPVPALERLTEVRWASLVLGRPNPDLASVLDQRVVQLARSKRLEKVAVATLGETPTAVLVEGVGGDGDSAQRNEPLTSRDTTLIAHVSGHYALE